MAKNYVCEKHFLTEDAEIGKVCIQQDGTSGE